MLYEELLTGVKPYRIRPSKIHRKVQEHRHPDVEFAYCISGNYNMIVDKQLYQLQAGDLVVIGSMVSHEVPEEQPESFTLNQQIGPVMLKEFFQLLTERRFAPLYSLSTDSPLRKLLEETAEIYPQKTPYAELLSIGNLYKIIACICMECTEVPAAEPKEMPQRSIMEIEKALELIYNHYSQDITVETAAAITGYSKSNFCNVFKNIVGESFHHMLNRYRVENACYFLKETNTTLSDIALMVGFSDAKSLCRVFKKYYGITPGEYRQNTR